MEKYNNLVNLCIENLSDKLKCEEFKSWFENYLDFFKPDFITILDLKNENRVIFNENFNFKFAEGKEETIDGIISSVDEDQKEKMYKIDKIVYKFAKKNSFIDRKYLFHMLFTASFEGESKTYLRDIYVLSNGILLVSLKNVSVLAGVQKNINVDIKHYKNNKEVIDKNLLKLKEEINKVITPKINLTKREREILELIAAGKTSEEIAETLSISVFTVNTHRQNIIKKFNVKNTAALIQLL